MQHCPEGASLQLLLLLLWGGGVLLSDRNSHAQEKKEDEDNGQIYSTLSPEEQKKVLSYTFMVQALQAQNILRTKTFHPEDALDHLQDQQKLFATGGPYEFSEGYLYHGRGNLKQALLNNALPEQSCVTRVPQTWALQPFVDLEDDPAIYVIDALDFNRQRNKGKAGMKLEPFKCDLGFYIAEPYPWLSDPYPIDKILKIIINKDTHNKLVGLVKKWEEQPSELSEQDQAVAQRFKELIDKNKIDYISTPSNQQQETMERSARFMEIRKELELHLGLYGMTEHMPKFRLRTKNSTSDNDKSPEPMSASDALKSLKNDLEGFLEEIQKKEERKKAAIIEKARQEKVSFWKNLGLGTGLAGGIATFFYWAFTELNRALDLQAKEQTKNESSPLSKNRKRRKNSK